MKTPERWRALPRLALLVRKLESDTSESISYEISYVISYEILSEVSLSSFRTIFLVEPPIPKNNQISRFSLVSAFWMKIWANVDVSDPNSITFCTKYAKWWHFGPKYLRYRVCSLPFWPKVDFPLPYRLARLGSIVYILEHLLVRRYFMKWPIIFRSYSESDRFWVWPTWVWPIWVWPIDSTLLKIWPENNRSF